MRVPNEAPRCPEVGKMQFCRMLKSIEDSLLKNGVWEGLDGVRIRQVGNIEAQDGIMIVYENRYDAKLRTEKSVLSKEYTKPS